MKIASSILAFFLILVIFTSGNLGCTLKKEINLPIVLLTDYGSEDYRISQLKGIIFSQNSKATLIDASHSVPPFDISTGAFILNVAANEFPENVVFIAIVAPYNQILTRYLVLTNNKNQIFVLPDNGLATYIAKNIGIKQAYEVNNPALFDKPLKELNAEHIQGRMGALIASGYSIDDIGSLVTDFTMLDIQEPIIANEKLLGTIVYIDHYGNAVTNIPVKIATDFGVRPGDMVTVKVLGNIIPVKFGTIYSDVPQGEEIMFISSNLGVVQISINLGNFSNTYEVKAGTKIEIEK